MPQRLSRATVATCAALAVAVFGGAYALAHGDPAKPAPAPDSPTAIRLAHAPIGTLHRVRSLPALAVPRRRPKVTAPAVTVPAQATPVQAAPVQAAPVQVTPTPAPTPTPTPQTAPAPRPTPRRPAPAKPPVTFDDSG